MLGIPVSSTLQSAVKQVAMSSGQILVAKGSPSVSKVVGGKQVLAQGVAKAIVSGASGISAQPATAKTSGGSSGKSGGQRLNTYIPVHVSKVMLYNACLLAAIWSLFKYQENYIIVQTMRWVNNPFFNFPFSHGYTSAAS